MADTPGAAAQRNANQGWAYFLFFSKWWGRGGGYLLSLVGCFCLLAVSEDWIFGVLGCRFFILVLLAYKPCFLGSSVVPSCPFYFRVPLSKLNSRKRVTLVIIMGLVRSL